MLNVDAAPRAYDYNKWELDFLIDHIVNIHHTYVQESIPLIVQYANRVEEVHGHHYIEVIEINKLFTEVASELASHMKKEEIILFPYIKKLLNLKKDGCYAAPPPFGTVNNPIKIVTNHIMRKLMSQTKTLTSTSQMNVVISQQVSLFEKAQN